LNTAVDDTFAVGLIGLLATGRDDSVGSGAFFDDLTVRVFTPPVPTTRLSPDVVIPSAELTEGAIRRHQNSREIISEFTKAFLSGQIQQDSVISLSATTGDRTDVIDIWFQEGLQTGDGFQVGLTARFKQVGDAEIREIKGNMFTVLKQAPLTVLPQGSAVPGRARLATQGPVLPSFGYGNLRIALANVYQPWNQPSPKLKLLPIAPTSRGDVGRKSAGPTEVPTLLQPSRQSGAGIGFGTGEPPGGLLIVQGDQVTLVDENGATLARFEF